MRISDWSSDVCSSDLHKILERDLRSLAHVDLELLRALRTEVAARTPDQTVRVANADAVIEEVEEADLIVITCPIYASSIPSTLKAWIEYMNRAGRTFRHDHDGHVGLITGKQIYVVVTRGSEPSEGLQAFAEGYLSAVLGSFGMSDITFINAHETAHEDGPHQIAAAEDRAPAPGRAHARPLGMK